MAIALRCKCGKVRGEVTPGRGYTRATCYCKDCRAYLRFLRRDDLANKQGGTDIIAMAPDSLAITSGEKHLACVSLSKGGILRWYAGCCRTPLGNTPRDAKIPYLGMVAACFDASPAAIATAFGQRDRLVINSGSAVGEVRSTPLGFAWGGLGILRGMLVSKLRRRSFTAFFDASGRPICNRYVLNAVKRDALGANPP